MSVLPPRRAVLGALASAALVVVSVLGAAIPASAATGDVYDAIPDPLPGNAPSQPFQAQRTAEFGQRVTLSAAGGTLETVTVGFSSWACQRGTWSTGDCVTTPGATFSHPVTVTVYSANAGQLGTALATTTETITAPFRPSPSPVECGTEQNPNPTQWYSEADGECYNGLVFTWTFDLSSSGLALPGEVVVGVAFDTQSYGAHPIGVTGPYDALNVAVDGVATVGAPSDPDEAFWDSTYNGRPAGFAPDLGWGELGPVMLAITASTPDPASALPATGSTSGHGPLVLGAMAALALGALALAVVARRRAVESD